MPLKFHKLQKTLTQSSIKEKYYVPRLLNVNLRLKILCRVRPLTFSFAEQGRLERSQPCAGPREDLTGSPVHSEDISSGTSQSGLRSCSPTLPPSLLLPWWDGLKINSLLP
ncbi:hypothetical protein ATANTOWER_012073 [Ataeniobius toweri]|uniref:Uncharacterized protein n=1 Tax=Ataeniobius toweri TaxID=208326 RepID=A0ABU7BY68_9TELE|nr:hypothetical protein [Ataeniobius toweri]